MSEDKQTDWELKDLRMAWMNMNTACSVIIAARINAGLFKPKDMKESMKELLDSINVGYQAFLNLRSGDVLPARGEESNPPRKEEKSPGWICKSCGKEILYKKVAEYSMDKFGEYLCYDCQNKPSRE